MGRRLVIDPVTGAGKRDSFDRRLSERIQASDCGRFAVMLWDVDGLQSINELFGPLIGDSVLQNMVKQCQRMIRGGDYLGRYGDDEFAIILDDVDEILADRRGQEIVRALSNLSNGFSDGFEQHDFKVSISMGIAEFEPGDTPGSLLQRTEQALLRAKRQGQGLCRSFGCAQAI